MRSQNLKVLFSKVRILALIGTFILSLTNCISPTSPNGEGEADIIVYNEYGEPLDIYMNGSFKFSIQHKSHIEIDNVSFGEYELEARKEGASENVASTTIQVEENIDYTWTIDDPPDIYVSNLSGKTVEIYMDGAYQFDLVDEENRWIIDVSYGEHFLKAIRKTDGIQIASTTIDATENTDYYWTIE